MADTTRSYSEFTVHIVLATTPQQQERQFDKIVRKSYFGAYRDEAGKYFADGCADYWYYRGNKNVPVLYSPIAYYMLGNYDVAYITLIDNLKFAQRLFEPHLLAEAKQAPQIFSPHSFQSFTGISCESADNLKKFFYSHLNPEKQTRKYFTAICNVKLNNGFLIGNGLRFLDAAIEGIRRQIAKLTAGKPEDKQVEFLVLQSFSWFELSLLMFSDDPEQLSGVIIALRRMTIDELPGYAGIIDNSVYKKLITTSTEKEFAQAHVFADTQSHFGLHADLVNCRRKDPFVTGFIAKKIRLKTETEWQVKPGHMHLLIQQLKSGKLLPKTTFNLKRKHFLLGKSDYAFAERSPKANNSLFLLRAIFDNNCTFFDHVRKIRTRVYFSPPPSGENEDESRSVISFHKALKELGVRITEFGELDKKLKALKISRQIRSKLLKIFSNFNNGIQDIILFPFFLDFSIFIDDIKDMIAEYADDLERTFKDFTDDDTNQNISFLEKNLMHKINIFQEGFNVRMLNCYQFEDISDFDLDFNSSIQQLLSIYSTIAFEIGNLFYPEYKYGPMVQLNLKDTVSNYNSINYYVHHLTSPEFIFATLTKEVLNFSEMLYPELKTIFEIYEDKISMISEKDGILFRMKEEGLIDLSYLLNDGIRFVNTYNSEFDLFYYWFWTYNLQNTSLYDKTGVFSEQHFRTEMFRVLFVRRLFNCGDNKLQCPLPELYTYWDRNYDTITVAVSDYLTFLDKHQISNNLMQCVFGTLDYALKIALADCNIEVKNQFPAKTRFNELTKHYSYTGKDDATFIANMAKRMLAYERLSTVKPNDEKGMCVPADSVLYLQFYMYDYLRKIAAENHNRFYMLRRNWRNGQPLTCFVHGEKEDHLYAVDQTGGLFFDHTTKLGDYFKYSSCVLTDIWHYSQVRKKHFMLKKLNIQDEPK